MCRTVQTFVRRCSGPHLGQLGLTPDKYVLFLGRLSPEKNCHLLIGAFEEIAGSAKLVFAGGSSHSDSYVTNLKKTADSRVIFTSWLTGDALEEVLTNASVLVLPSDIEGLSLSLLDAMAAGLCVLASDIPENNEAIGEAGFLFKNGDVQDLRRMLTMLLADPEVRAISGDKARARVQQNYLWDDVAAQTEKLYFDLMREGPITNFVPAAKPGRKAA
jgi:glycosyltransferase involved in cell wall biosynthesis